MTILSYVDIDKRKKQEFFGDINNVSNSYFTFKRYKDNNNIVILTDNIDVIKGSLVMYVGDNKVIYLQDYQVKPVMNYELGIYTFAVKLNRNKFKIYKLRSNTDYLFFNKEDTFDDLINLAIEQDDTNLKVREGWGKRRIIYELWKRHNFWSN